MVKTTNMMVLNDKDLIRSHSNKKEITIYKYELDIGFNEFLEHMDLG